VHLAQVRRLPLGNLVFKTLGALGAIARCCRRRCVLLQQLVPDVHQRGRCCLFHLGFNVLLALVFISFTGLAGWVAAWGVLEGTPGSMPTRRAPSGTLRAGRHSLAIACAARGRCTRPM
jgi:phosphate:Na+ symporter